MSVFAHALSSSSSVCHCENCCLGLGSPFHMFHKSLVENMKWKKSQMNCQHMGNICGFCVVAGFVCATCFFGFRVRPEIEKVSKRTAFKHFSIEALSHLCAL